MPILRSIPPDVQGLDFGDPACGLDRSWWVLHTKPRQEKALGRALRDRGLSYFLALAEVRGRWPTPRKARDGRKPRRRGDTFRSIVPLFPSYLFLCGDEFDRIEVVMTDRVVGTIPVLDVPRLVSELRSLDAILRSGEPVTVGPPPEVGRKVLIRDDQPFAGCEGVIERVGSKRRLHVLIHALGTAVSVEYDVRQVKVLA